MKIDVVDMDDPVLGTHRRNLAQSSGSEVIEMYGMCNGISQMVLEIQRIAGVRSIEVLRIWGHGWSGGQLIAAGGAAQVGVDHGSALWQHNLERFGPQLKSLRSLFAPGAHVELKGCQVASGEAGEQFLLGLARLFNVPVMAGVQTQGGAWTPGQHWNGDLVIANPQGGLASAMYTAL